MDEREETVFQRLDLVLALLVQGPTLLVDIEAPLLEFLFFGEMMGGIPWYTLLELQKIGAYLTLGPEQLKQLPLMELVLPSHLV
jgi:hypothetical protein